MALDGTCAAAASLPEGEYLAMDVEPLGEVTRTPEGYLEAPALITRTGVFEYLITDGEPGAEATRVERHLRLPEEVFDPESIASMDRKPITRGHPWFKRVDATTWRDVSVGIVDQLRPADDGTHLAGRVLIQDARTIEAVDGGERQMSSAYYYAREPIPDGKWVDVLGVLGKKGAIIEADLIQRRIRGNHHAIVQAGRAGPTAAIQLDNAESHTMNPDQIKALVAEQMSKAIGESDAKHKLALDAASAEQAKTKTELDLVRAENAKLRIAQDASDKQAAIASVKALVAKHEARLGISDATRVAVEPALLALDEHAIKARVIEGITGVKPTSDDPVYVNAAYATAVAMDERAASAYGSAVGAVGVGARALAQDEKSSLAAAKAAYLKTQTEAWKTT